MEPGAVVRAARQSSGVTQEQLAIRAGTTTSAISRLERGHVSPTVTTLETLLLCLGRDLELGSARREPRTEMSQLDAVATMTATERIEHGLASMGSIGGLVGAARA